MTELFVLIATAVYDQGIYGVFTEEEAAVAHAEMLIDASDWHHDFRVEAFTIDEPREVDGTLIGCRKEPTSGRRGRPRPQTRLTHAIGEVDEEEPRIHDKPRPVTANPTKVRRW